MADEIQEISQGIKLFGATIITCHQEKNKPKDNNNNNNVIIKVETSENNKDVDEDDQQQKMLMMRPDKIIPCPRCNSMETKFCYFNNYNVNQPRHFCKGCQRYWTAGGALRNVPVGAGRRKNKPPCRGINGLFDAATAAAAASGLLQHFDLDGVVEDWHAAATAAGLAADHGGFQDLLPTKRRRKIPAAAGQPC